MIGFGSNILSNASPTFGNVQIVGNSILTATGQNNRGQVQSNACLNLSSSNSHLSILSCANSKVNIENCQNLIIHSCANLNFTGKRNNASITSDCNCFVSGDDNNWEFRSNCNPTVKSTGSTLKLFGNNNPNVDVIGGNVLAEKNLNFRVKGQGNNLVIKNTKNHDVKPAPMSCETGPKVNLVQLYNNSSPSSGSIVCTNSNDSCSTTITKTTAMTMTTPTTLISAKNFSMTADNVSFSARASDFALSMENFRMTASGVTITGSNANAAIGSRSLLSVLGGGGVTSSAKFAIEYVDEAVIDGINYSLGIFKFTMQLTTAGSFEVKLDESGLDSESMSTYVEEDNELVVNATSKGEAQTLRFMANEVSASDKPNTFILN